MESFREDFTSVVIGASGGIGSAITEHLKRSSRCSRVLALSRSGTPGIDLTIEESVAAAAEWTKKNLGTVDLAFVASGILSPDEKGPEKSIRQIDGNAMEYMFAVNTIGPALVTKYFTPLLPRHGKSTLALLSARVGSIGDNRLGGWITYRASKAALNQVIRTVAIELARTRPEAVCLALHPGTVATKLSAGFIEGRDPFTPEQSARQLLSIIDQTGPEQSGSFLAYNGEELVW